MTISLISNDGPGGNNQNPFWGSGTGVGQPLSNGSGDLVVTADSWPCDFTLVHSGDCILVFLHVLTTGYVPGSSTVSSANVTWHRVLTSPPPLGSDIPVSTEVWFGIVTGTVTGISCSVTVPANSDYAVEPSGFILRSTRGSPQWGYPAVDTFFVSNTSIANSYPVPMPALAPGAGCFAAWEFSSAFQDSPAADDSAHYSFGFNIWVTGPAGFGGSWLYTVNSSAGVLTPGYNDDMQANFPFEQFNVGFAVTDTGGSLVPYSPSSVPTVAVLPTGFSADGRPESARVYSRGMEPGVTARGDDRDHM